MRQVEPLKVWRRMSRVRRVLVGSLAGAVVGAVVMAVVGGGSASAADSQLPITAMFFYDESFRHSNDHYHPAVGFDSDNVTSVAHQVVAMRDNGMQAAIASWWGQGQHVEQTRFPILYGVAAANRLGVIPYYEPEGQGDPSVAQIQSDLAYLAAYDSAIPGANVHIGGKPVIFVYNAGSTGCDEVTKWKQATNGFSTWYVNMKVFSASSTTLGFRDCPDQPSSWHQYGPATAESIHLPYSFNISPGFWHHDSATPRLARDPARWVQNVAHLKASTAQWKLVTSWNEWGEATSVEPSPSWQSPSGWGFYADELRRQLVDNQPAPSPSPSPSPTASPSPTSSPTPSPTATTPSPSPTTPSPSPTTPSPSPTGTPGSVTVLAGGDIVCQACSGFGTTSGMDGYTARLISRIPHDAVLTLGDNQYESGTAAEFTGGWGRTSGDDAWGRHLSEVYPAPGNHEWNDLAGNAAGYRTYFRDRLAAIGSDTPSGNQMYYSFDLGAWHFISLDSDCSKVGGCGSVSNPMVAWMLTDLAANNGRPTIVYHHHPRWSSGSHGSNECGCLAFLNGLLLADLDVQIVLAGHDHIYERFNPMGASGPQANGIRYFTVGTGGKNHTTTFNPIPGSATGNTNTFGLLALTLSPTGYSWQFHNVREAGATTDGSFTDSSNGTVPLRSGSTPSPTLTSPPPSASPSPSPTAAPLLDCMRQADRCGWPTAATTGPRSPVVLTTYTGPLPLVIPAGQTRSGLIVPGCVRLQAGASLVDSIVRPTANTLCGGYGAIDQEWPSIQHNVALRFVEVDLHLAGADRMGIRAITGDGFELDHVHCWGGADCVHYGAEVYIHDSYLHTPPCQTVQTAAVCDTLHIDALHSASSPVLGALVLVVHNTIIAEENNAAPHNWATSAWINGPAIPPYCCHVQSNVHGINNLFAGGGYTVYCEAHREQPGSVPMAEFVGNRFSDLYYPRSGYYGATTDCAPLANYSTNTWDRTGLPLGAENPRPV